jgi:hypothetical protein
MSFNVGDLLVEEYHEEVWVVTGKNVAAPKGPSYEKWYLRLDYLYSMNKDNAQPSEKVRYAVPKIVEQEFIVINESPQYLTTPAG